MNLNSIKMILTILNNSSKKSFILNRLEKFQTLKTQVKDYELTKKININWGKDDKWNKLLNRVYSLKE